MRRTFAAALLSGALLLAGGAAQAASLTSPSGDLAVTIRDDNGAIDTLQFMGTEYYKFNPLGVPVADYGFHVPATGDFALFDTDNIFGTSATVIGDPTGTSATATGSAFSGVNFARIYTLLGDDALSIVTTVTNATGAPLALRLSDTLDPDQGDPQGLGTETTNDVTVSGGTTTGTSAAGDRSVAFASSQPGVLIGFGGGISPFGLGIDSGFELDEFFLDPYDPNGLLEDIGVAIAVEAELDPDETFTFAYVQEYGITGGGVVPEPATLTLLGTGLIGLAALRRRRPDPLARSGT